jgi:glucose-6-phosphate-specific signal transduction histidine kinase
MSETPILAFDMKRFLSTGLFVVATLLAFRLFPADAKMDETLQSGVLGAVFFLLLPMLYVVFVRKESLSTIGFQGSVKPRSFLAVPIAVIPCLVVWYTLLAVDNIGISYSLPGFVQRSFLLFILYETVLVGVISLLFEVFFRGLIMLSWLSNTGMFAVFLQGFLFVAFVAIFSSIDWGSVPMILAAFGAGAVAYRTKSIYYSWFSGWLILFLSDVIFLVMGR